MKQLHRFLSMLLALVLCVGVLAGTVGAATVDSQPPVIDKDSITISKETATVGDTITVTVKVTDNVAVDWVTIDFWNNDTSEQLHLWMTGTEGSDIFSCEFVVTKNTPAGIWRVFSILAYDTTKNTDSIYFSTDECTFSITGTSDSMSILAQDIAIDKTEATVGDTVTISAKVGSEKVKRVSLGLINETSGRQIHFLEMTYDKTADRYVYCFAINDTIQSGYWNIVAIDASDENGYGIAEFTGNPKKGFTVYGTSADTEAPIVDNTSLSFSPKEIAHGESAVISVKITDNSAVGDVYFDIENIETGKLLYCPEMTYNDTTDRYEFVLNADETIPSGHWRLCCIFAYDSADNLNLQSYYSWDYYILVKGENDHVWKTDEAVEATCTSTGLTEGSSCSICGKVNVAQENVDKLEHDFSNNAEYCRNGCSTKNPNYTAHVTPPYTPVRPTPTPVPTPVEPEQPENPFADVSKDDYFFDAVIWAVENGVTSSTSATTFDPHKVCTRAEMVTFLWRAARKPEPDSRNNPFTDVTENDYFYKAVLWAVENGITKGTSTTTFSSNDTCTRAQAATFLYRYAGLPKAIGANPFVDVQKTDYFFDAVIWAAEEEITKGTGATTFSSNDFCTRAQIVTFLYRAQKK